MPTGDVNRLRSLLEELRDAVPPDAAPVVEECISLTRRRVVKPRAPVKTKRVTTTIKAQVLSLYSSDPSLSVRDIANICGINQGRVSEIISGER